MISRTKDVVKAHGFEPVKRWDARCHTCEFMKEWVDDDNCLRHFCSRQYKLKEVSHYDFACGHHFLSLKEAVKSSHK